MTNVNDADWGEEGPKKSSKGIPPWVWWGCGGGCLLLTLLVIASAVFLGKWVHDASDPDKAWSGVQELLAFDERPADWTAFGTQVMGHSFYLLTAPGDGRHLLVQGFRDQEQLDALFDPEFREAQNFFGYGRRLEPEAGTIQIQGREVRCLRFRGALTPERREDRPGRGVQLDLSGEGTPTVVIVSDRDAEGPISEELVSELLKPFDVWRNR
jgi:hypothetical protein